MKQKSMEDKRGTVRNKERKEKESDVKIRKEKM